MVALAALVLFVAPEDASAAPPPTPAVEDVAPTSARKQPAVDDAPPVVAPTPDPTPAPTPAIEDRITLRDGGMMVGRIVAVQKGNYVTIVLAGSNESRTVSWALIDAYQVAGGPEQIASRGKPTIAELAAESDSIERQKNIGLGLAYGGYVSIPITLSLWTVGAFARDDATSDGLFVSATVSTALTVGLLTAGGILFFKARERRRNLREVQVSGQWLRGGGGLSLQGRF